MLMKRAAAAALIFFGASIVTLGSSAAFAADGATMYKGQCASCHGPDGKADTAVAKAMKVPALASKEVQDLSVDDIVKHIKEAAKHPAGVKGISDDDAKAIAEHIKTFGAQ